MENEQGINDSNPPKICPKCQSIIAEDQGFCTKCGERLKEGVTKKRDASSSSSLFGSIIDQEHRRHIRSARIAIMFVAVVTILLSIFLWFSLEGQLKEIMANPRMIINQNVLTVNRLIIGSTFLIGIIFLVLYFWAKKNPFAATLTALIIYLTNIIIAVGIDPKNLAKGAIVKIIIIAVLGNGVKSGLAFRKLQKKPESVKS